MTPPTPYIVGICGGSASGKSYLLQRLLEQLPEESVTLISLDNYYKPLEEQVRDEAGLVNFDHPDSLYLDRLTADVKRIMAGETVIQKEYTFNNPFTHAKDIVLKPAPLIILEGLFVFHPQALQPLLHLKVFVEAHEHIKLARRLRRDNAERGYTIESILTDYAKYVAPMYHQFVAPTKETCDLIVPNHDHMEGALTVLKHHLLAVLRGDS
ncbi:MAG: uridine kinase [Bacteroidota bacterium]